MFRFSGRSKQLHIYHNLARFTLLLNQITVITKCLMYVGDMIMLNCQFLIGKPLREFDNYHFHVTRLHEVCIASVISVLLITRFLDNLNLSPALIRSLFSLQFILTNCLLITRSFLYFPLRFDSSRVTCIVQQYTIHQFLSVQQYIIHQFLSIENCSTF